MPRSPLVMLLLFAVTLFTSATLLFLVEPMIGKMILPLLGGTPAVWNTAMVFFQAVLLAGYAYAHFSTAWLGARKQAVLHLGLLVLPFWFLPLTVNSDLIQGGDNPIPGLLLLLTLTVGLPMFVVSASAPLLQKWFASTTHPAAQDPYFLYGASNLGSMIALIGYPTVVEPYLRLGQQSIDWTAGYGLLAALTVVCAVFLWRSPQSQEPRAKSQEPNTARLSTLDSGHSALSGEVTWRRVLRWVALAFVPSSLMLGATTYITTDIAAIPLLWVTPLALYLLSFIIVFSRVPSWVHKGMVLAMPLLVLTVLFFMLSELNLPIAGRVAMHLATLFVVSMVCHGELARDRPAAQYLTGYYLWMSLGGVLGGMFNGLLAPVIFRGIVEYELVMMLACLLAPPLGPANDTPGGRRFDTIMAGLCAGIGLLLIALRLRDADLPYELVKDAPWPWLLAALVVGLAIGLSAAVLARGPKFDRYMNVLLPLSLGVLLIGLSWGLPSNAVWRRLQNLARLFHLDGFRLFYILTYGVPLVLTYTFVERSLRFGLGVGAVLLASGFCDIFEYRIVHQERGFFGVLKVERWVEDFDDEVFVYRRLVHGTTLHGVQILNEDRRDEPVTYYHRTGPIGELMMAYNGPNMPPEKMNLAVIGLGTGTMAAYARPGQHLTFYDIDPIVKRLSFDEGDGPFPYFTFVQQARDRGAHLELVMGDARLTMEKKQLKEPEKYGAIVVDAFSSDAIPIHLITLQALDVYLDKLSADGLLCFHISNRYLDLRPVLYNLAQKRGLAAVYQSDNHEIDLRSTALLGKSSSTWVVLSPSKERLKKLLALNDWEDERQAMCLALRKASLCPDQGIGLIGQTMLLRNFLDEELCQRPAKWEALEPDETWPDVGKVGIWTDDYSNLLSVFWW